MATLPQVYVFNDPEVLEPDSQPLFITVIQNGWTPTLVTYLRTISGVTDVVLKVTNWTGGYGVKPQINLYLSTSGFVSDVSLATPISSDGGWTPITANVIRTNDDGSESVVQQVINWIGNYGTKPDVDVYIAEDGFTEDIDAATDIKGSDTTIQSTVADLRLSTAVDSTIYYVTDQDGFYVVDTTDTTTVDDGLFTIVSLNGKRVKKRSNGGALTITSSSDFAKVDNKNANTVLFNDLENGGIFKWFSSGYVANSENIFAGKTGFWVALTIPTFSNDTFDI